VIIALVLSLTSIRAASTHVPFGSALFAPLHCVAMANKGNIQFPALSHCRSPKNKHVLDCSFTEAAKHADHPSFLDGYRIQSVAGTCNIINNPFFLETFPNCSTPKHLTHFTTYFLQIHTLLGI